MASIAHVPPQPGRDASAPVLFHAKLRPHCSLSPGGFRVLMAVVVLAFSGIGSAFYALGAWPVVGFCGLEVLLIWWCFRLNFRHLERYETILLTPDALEIRRVDPKGRVERIVLQPYWMTVRLEEEPSGANRLLLRSHGRDVAVGGFLSPEERVDLKQALDAALRQPPAPAL